MTVSRPVEIVLVRHGRTAWNAERRFLGQTDVPLDDVGLAEAAALAEACPFGPFHHVASSTLSRAWQTAEHLSAAVERHDGLRELDQGQLEGLHAEEAIARFGAFFKAWARDPTEVPVPGGEALGACRDRAWEALRALGAQRAPGERLVVVTHQLVIASVHATASGQPLARWREHAVDNTGWRRLQFDGVGLVPG